MAIWQYKLFVLPEEEVSSYFSSETSITDEALNEIEWWKYRQSEIICFDSIKELLSPKKSWSNSIILFGDVDSSCLEVLIESEKIVEVSIRIDLRANYRNIIVGICEFCQQNSLMLLNYRLELLAPNAAILEEDIIKYKTFNEFIKQTRP